LLWQKYAFAAKLVVRTGKVPELSRKGIENGEWKIEKRYQDETTCIVIPGRDNHPNVGYLPTTIEL
jgi:hypothetical protein